MHAAAGEEEQTFLISLSEADRPTPSSWYRSASMVILPRATRAGRPRETAACAHALDRCGSWAGPTKAADAALCRCCCCLQSAVVTSRRSRPVQGGRRASGSVSAGVHMLQQTLSRTTSRHPGADLKSDSSRGKSLTCGSKGISFACLHVRVQKPGRPPHNSAACCVSGTCNRSSTATTTTQPLTSPHMAFMRVVAVSSACPIVSIAVGMFLPLSAARVCGERSAHC